MPRSTPSPSSSPSSSRSSSPSPSASRGDEDPGSSSSKPGPLHLHSPLDWLKVIGRNSRRLAVFVVGVAILGAGAAMVVLPGPGVLVMLVGLAVLATEFAWAERALDRTAGAAATAASKVSGSRSGRLALVASGLGMVVGGAV
ncbi:MAG: PGPGW domain-containing protein, partial [Actinomycetes bacterium]